jgi:hypothetical protein
MQPCSRFNNRLVVPCIERIWRHDKTAIRFLRKFSKNPLNVSGIDYRPIEIAPGLRRVGLVYNQNIPANVDFLRVAQGLAGSVGVTVTPTELRI